MSCDVPRYLVPFHPKRIPHHFADVLIIGGGIAGLRAAMAIDPRLSLLVITKDTMEQSNSAYAQGGIAGVIDPEDRFERPRRRHARRRRRICATARSSRWSSAKRREHIRQLIEWGTHFDTEHGELLLGREGGHSHRRIVHALGDATGQEVMRAMIERVRSKHDAQVLAEHVHARLADARRALPRRAGLERAARARRSSGPSKRFSAPAARGRFIARRPIPKWPPATATRSPIAPAPSCATWSSCSSIRPCCTSPAAAAA